MPEPPHDRLEAAAGRVAEDPAPCRLLAESALLLQPDHAVFRNDVPHAAAATRRRRGLPAARRMVAARADDGCAGRGGAGRGDRTAGREREELADGAAERDRRVVPRSVLPRQAAAPARTA